PIALLVAAAPMARAASLPGAHISAAPEDIQQAADYPGIQHLHYKFGPIQIAPGQNNIEAVASNDWPDVPGYITRFKPDLTNEDGTVPPVDIIHLHHGVWLRNGLNPLFAAGEEKTVFNFPQGFGLHN